MIGRWYCLSSKIPQALILINISCTFSRKRLALSFSPGRFVWQICGQPFSEMARTIFIIPKYVGEMVLIELQNTTNVESGQARVEINALDEGWFSWFWCRDGFWAIWSKTAFTSNLSILVAIPVFSGIKKQTETTQGWFLRVTIRIPSQYCLWSRILVQIRSECGTAYLGFKLPFCEPSVNGSSGRS